MNDRLEKSTVEACKKQQFDSVETKIAMRATVRSVTLLS